MLCFVGLEGHARSQESSWSAHSGAAVEKIMDPGALSTLNPHAAIYQLCDLEQVLSVSASSSVKWD